MNNNKNTVWIVVGVIVVAILIIWGVMAHQKSVTMSETATTTDSMIAPEGTEDTSAGSANATTVGSAPVTLSYANALVKYADRRIQLDNNCQATPNNVTFKNHTDIMIDNRSADTKTIKVGSVYSVKGYGFKIVNLNYASLPATFLLDCGSYQNVATILIQK